MTTNIITKKFVPCIYLYRGYAVKSLKDLTIVDTDPLRLARYYSEHNADELILFDLSEQAAQRGCLKKRRTCLGSRRRWAGRYQQCGCPS